MYFTYILQSKKDLQQYIGFTTNIIQRVTYHNSGKVRSTRKRRPLVLIYYEMHLSKKDAMRRERYFKTSKGKSTIRMMLRDYLENTQFIIWPAYQK